MFPKASPILLGQALAGTVAYLAANAVHAQSPVAAGVTALAAMSVGLLLNRAKAAEPLKTELDPLTGVPLREAAEMTLCETFACGEFDGRVGAVMVVGLDGFRHINEARGHDAGDDLLQAVCARLQACVAGLGDVARLGGDEFIVTVRPVQGGAADATMRLAELAQDIRLAMGEPHSLKDSFACITASVGVSIYMVGDAKAQALIQQACMAMSQAKASGRNAVIFFDKALQEQVGDRLAMERDLSRALDDRSLSLHYQVQVNASGEAVGAEALLRWRRGNLGYMPPSEFIPVAENSGLIVSIGSWVLQEACKTLNTWATTKGFEHLTLAVNVSPHQFAQAEFVHQVESLLSQYDFPVERLKFEVTEGALIRDEAAVVTKMRDLQLMGVRLSMDDFGTGYSSLSRLKILPLEQIKIDRSFVRDITADLGNAMLVSAIIDMSNSLALKVVAEGVEKPEQFALLRKQGCEIFQGYLFGRPLPQDQFEASILSASSLQAMLTGEREVEVA